MESQKFFEDALSNFTNQVAYGDAVKRLAAEGLLVSQIMERLNYPAPVKKVEKMAFEHLCEIGVILHDIPKAASFIEVSFAAKDPRRLNELLCKKCGDNGEEASYAAFDFAPLEKDRLFKLLDRRQREYMEWIFENGGGLYHRLNFRIREIIYELYGQEGFSAVLYFIKTKEKITLNAPGAGFSAY